MEPAASYIALPWYLIFVHQFSPNLGDEGQDNGPCRRVYFTVGKLSLTHQGSLVVPKILRWPSDSILSAANKL